MEDTNFSSEELRRQVKTLLASLDLSANKAAKQIGISGAALSTWLNDKYQADAHELERKVVGWIERNAELQEMPEESLFVRTVETSVFRKVTGAIRHAHLQGKIAMVTAASGAGKTRAITEYVNSHPGAIHIECHHSFPVRAVLQEIARAAGLEIKGDIHTMLMAVSEKMHGSQKVIILDESEHLQAKVLDVVRRIWDFAGVGIVYVGLPRFAATVRSLKAEYIYIWNRVRIKREIETTAQVAFGDLELLLKDAMPGAEKFAGLFSSFCGADFRQAEELFFTSVLLAKNQGEELSERVIKAVARQLELTDKRGAR